MHAGPRVISSSLRQASQKGLDCESPADSESSPVHSRHAGGYTKSAAPRANRRTQAGSFQGVVLRRDMALQLYVPQDGRGKGAIACSVTGASPRVGHRPVGWSP
jgi:hypothetical protein